MCQKVKWSQHKLKMSSLTKKGRSLTSYNQSCSQEEADATYLLMHIHDISRQGYKKAIEGNVDTDVIVIALFQTSTTWCGQITSLPVCA